MKNTNSKLYDAIRGVCLANSSYLRDFFNLHKVEVHLESGVTEIGDGFIKIKDKEGKIAEAKTDSAITSISYKEAIAFENNGNVLYIFPGEGRVNGIVYFE